MNKDADKRLADDKNDTEEKGVKAGREKTAPYASEVDDYANDAVKSPEPEPRRTEINAAKTSK
jgi:hypothetical protein